MIVELEQIGVNPTHSGKGLGKRLVKESYELFSTHVESLEMSVGALLVTTSEGNFAENMYKSALGVERAAKIEGYGSGDELILYRRY